MFSLQWKCPHCAREESFTLTGVTEYSAKSQVQEGSVFAARSVLEPMPTQQGSGTIQMSGMPVAKRKGSEITRAYGVSVCPNCNGPILIWFECAFEALQRVKQSTNDWTWRYAGQPPKILGVYPEGEKPDDSPHYPDALRRVFVELQEDIRAGRTAPRIVVGCRSVLEVALKSLGYEGRQTLFERINKAREDGLLTESMREWAHRIRLDGNEAAHELNATDDEAREFVDFLRLFMEVAFVLPTRIPKK
jgi:hypothetical protein